MKRYFSAKLLHWKEANTRKPLVIQGVRQVGKTYIVKEFGVNHFARMHYVNFEKNRQFHKIFALDFNPARILEELSFVLDAPINIEDDLIFFDEIQECPLALTSLKYFQEEMPELAVCAAGSLLGVHLLSSSFPVGKVDLLDLYPMNFSEFLLALNDKKSVDFLDRIDANTKIPDIVHEHLWQRLKLYFIVGGLPEVVKIFSDEQDNIFAALTSVRQKQDELILAYYADMAKHCGKVNALHLDRIWRSIPAQLARQQNAAASKFKFLGVVPGINRYHRLAHAIDWLAAAGLIIKVPIVNSGQLPFSAYSKESVFKLFMADVGLLTAMSDLHPRTILNYDYGTYKGYFAENFVAQALCSTGIKHIYSWQEGRNEVEFLRDFYGKVIPIEVKSGWVTKAKSLKAFAQKYNPDYSIILSAQNLYQDKIQKVYRYPLYLADKLPLLIEKEV